MKTGIQLIAAERERQLTEEGWSEAHDDKHIKGEMAMAAACYANDYAEEARFGDPKTERQAPPRAWPWSMAWWKPQGRKARLIKAGALIAAELDRLNRMEASPKEE